MDKPMLEYKAHINWGVLIFLGIFGLSLGSILEWIAGDYFSPYLFPRPGQLFSAFAERPLFWFKAAIYTILMSVAAGVIGVLLGVFVGAVSAYHRLWSVDRWSQLIWSIPLIAIAVYLLLVIGFGWGYGLALGVFLGFYPIEKHAFDYCATPSEGITSLCAAFDLTRFQEYRFLRIPGVFRSMRTAVAQALPLCFIGETMGEYTSAKISSFSIGLGGTLRYAQNDSNYADLWVAILLMMFLVFFSGELIKLAWDKFSLRHEMELVR